jgi:hypothetical protein
MKQHTITLYDYPELSKQAKERALSKWRETNDYPFLTEYLHGLLTEDLDALGIGYDPKSLKLYYSLSYCQGDGVMFEGQLTYEEHEVQIKHSGHYYHSHSKTVTWDFDDIDMTPSSIRATDAMRERFEDVYQNICKKLERAGYDYIESEDSEETFADICEANEWTFEENGTMRNIVPL